MITRNNCKPSGYVYSSSTEYHKTFFLAFLYVLQVQGWLSEKRASNLPNFCEKYFFYFGCIDLASLFFTFFRKSTLHLINGI